MSPLSSLSVCLSDRHKSCLFHCLNQSIESADGGGSLKFYRPLELIGIYAEITHTHTHTRAHARTHAHAHTHAHTQAVHIFNLNCNVRAESQACATGVYILQLDNVK